jgi:hypothetical protein
MIEEPRIISRVPAAVHSAPIGRPEAQRLRETPILRALCAL